MILKHITHSKAAIGTLMVFFFLNTCLVSRSFANNSAQVGPEIIFQILASEIALISGNVSSAVVTYLDVASKTGDVGAAKRATELALAIRDHESALRAAEIWQKNAACGLSWAWFIKPVASHRNGLGLRGARWICTAEGRRVVAHPLCRRRTFASIHE